MGFVAMSGAEQMVKAEFGIGRQLTGKFLTDTQQAQTRVADGNQKRRHGFTAGRQVRQTVADQFRSGQAGEISGALGGHGSRVSFSTRARSAAGSTAG